MPTWGWIVFAIAIVVVVAAIVMSMLNKRRTKQLQSQFGPEYERTVEFSDSKRKAESELAARQERRAELDIRPCRRPRASATSRAGRTCRRSSSTTPAAPSRRPTS